MRRSPFVLLVTTLGCSAAAPAPPLGPSGDPGERALAVHIDARLSCASPMACERRLRADVEDAGGWLVLRTGPTEGPVDLVVRVPSAHRSHLDALLRELDLAAWTDERAADLTDTRADAAARLRNARATEARILALTASRAATLAEVLAAEQELARIREGIEVLEEGARTSARQVEMLELAVRIDRHRPSWGDAPGDAIATALVGGAEAAYGLAVGVVVVAAAVLPTGAITLVLLWLARWATRRWVPRVR